MKKPRKVSQAEAVPLLQEQARNNGSEPQDFSSDIDVCVLIVGLLNMVGKAEQAKSQESRKRARSVGTDKAKQQDKGRAAASKKNRTRSNADALSVSDTEPRAKKAKVGTSAPAPVASRKSNDSESCL